MKRLFSSVIIIIITFLCSATAETFYSLWSLQRFLLHNSPYDLSDSAAPTVELDGAIVEIVEKELWKIYRIEIDEEEAKNAYILDYEKPSILVRCRRGEFKIGDYVNVKGNLLVGYSSLLVPFIDSDQIEKWW